MAALSTQDRIDCGAGWQRDISAAREVLGAVTKADIQAAIAAIDDFLVTNANAINNAFPVATRTGLTTSQKARIVSYVMLKRYVKGA